MSGTSNNWFSSISAVLRFLPTFLLLLLLLTGCRALPVRNYLGMTRGEVAAVLEKEAFRSRRRGNRFVINDIPGCSGVHHLRNAQDVLSSESLMKTPQWDCDYYPERHWLLGWNGLFARWHFQRLDFENGRVVRQTAAENCYWVFGAAGESPYPLHPENFHKVNDAICRSGQPDADEMDSLSTFECIKSVLNLRENHSDREEVGNLKLELYEIPLAAGNIAEDDLVRILRTVKRAPKPLLIHCWHGSDRTGLAVAACRIVFENWSADQAVAELMDPQYGHHETIYKNIPELLRKADWNRIRKEVESEGTEK